MAQYFLEVFISFISGTFIGIALFLFIPVFLQKKEIRKCKEKWI